MNDEAQEDDGGMTVAGLLALLAASINELSAAQTQTISLLKDIAQATARTEARVVKLEALVLARTKR